MCRQFYRHCRDCQEPFPLPDMRECCEAFENAKATKPLLKRCPAVEIEVIRHPSGHGGRVCDTCGKRNRNDQRRRENAQKRARRAKLKKDRQTAGIGPGNIVWTATAPSTWRSSIVDAQTVALHSPQVYRKSRPRGPNIVSMRSTVAQRQVNISQLEHTAAYLESRQAFTTTTSNVLQPQEHEHGRIVTEVRNDTHLHSEYGPHYLPTPKSIVPQPIKTLDLPLRTPKPDPSLPTPPLPTTDLDLPLYQKQQDRPPVGLGITIPNEPKQEQSHSFFNEWVVELNEWSTVFDEDDSPDDAKEL